ncbi:MAG: replicative DNA helicase [Hyphomicrobiales bacterium]|nr:replicative DNA helicase [Hyphomicrobiales bacterium]
MTLAPPIKPDQPERLRLTPCDIETEQALLGAILINNDAFERVSSFLQPEHFQEPLHQRIYEAIGRVVRKGQLASPVTLRPYFALDASMKEVGGPDYLAEIVRFAPTVINAVDFGRMIFDLAQRRELIRVGEEIVNTAYDPPIDLSPSEQIEEAEKALYTIAEKTRFGGGFRTFKAAVSGAVEAAERAYQSPSHITGVPTGFRDLDNLLGGLQKSDLIILAARPGMGKTSFATNIAFHAARESMRTNGQSGARVAFFSLEMSAEQLATRILSEQAEIPSEKIRRGLIDESEFKRLVQVSQEMATIPLFIDQTGGITIAQLAARARKLKRQKGLGLLIIDYLQLLSGSGRRGSDNRVQEITEITTGLKALAKELAVPVIALSQLSRQVEQREDKRPQLSDLRESGSIEQDADVVMFVFREEYYVERLKPSEGTPEFADWMSKMALVAGKAEVIIGKQRHGPVGTVQLAFDGNVTRFSDLARDQYMPERLE